MRRAFDSRSGSSNSIPFRPASLGWWRPRRLSSTDTELTGPHIRHSLIFWGTTWYSSASPGWTAIRAGVQELLVASNAARETEVRAVPGELRSITWVTKPIFSTPAEPPEPLAARHLVTLIADLISANALPDPKLDPEVCFCVVLPAGTRIGPAQRSHQLEYFPYAGTTARYLWGASGSVLSAILEVGASCLASSDTGDPRETAQLPIPAQSRHALAPIGG